MIDLTGRVALITGASRGIGAAAALRFAQAGASVIVHYVSHEAEAQTVVNNARSLGVQAIAVQADMARFDNVAALFSRAAETFDRLDVVVANAGIWKRRPIEELNEERWDETLDTNLKGVYACCHFAARIMKRQGAGRIITVSSTAGQRGEAFYSHYAASKGGVIALSKSLASELGPHGITVNCVAPGWVETDMSADPLRIESELEKILPTIPLHRAATADEIAAPIVFLASDLASYITGEVLNVNGGSVLCG